MSPKRKKNKQFPQGNRPQNPPSSKTASSTSTASSSSISSVETSRSASGSTLLVQPEHMSLAAHAHVAEYMKQHSVSSLSDNEVIAVLKLSQHLRVFGLLSAVGFVKQSNQQSGETKERIRPVWESLLCQMLNDDKVNDNNSQPVKDAHELMTAVLAMTQQRPAVYMALWRRAIALSKHWSFWARAYQVEGKPPTASEGEP